MEFDPSSAKPVEVTFDPSSAKPLEAPKPVVAQESLKDKAKSMGLSALAGLASGGADITEGIADTPAFVMKHLHIISPETASKIMSDNQEVFDHARSSNVGDPSDVFNQAVSKHPMVHNVAKYGTDLAGLMEGQRLIPNVSGVAGVGTRALGNGLLAQGGANPEDKGSAFALGAAVSPAMDAIGAGLGVTGNKTNAINTVNDALDTSSKGNVNKLYDVVKKLPFSQEDQTATYNLGRKVEDYLGSNANKLTAQQQNLLSDMAEKLQMTGNHDEALKTLLSTGSKSKLFSGVNVGSDTIHDTFNGFKDELSGIINNAAIREGKPDALLDATVAAKKSRILDKVFGKMQDDVSSFNWKTASKNLNNQINKLDGQPGYQDTVDTLKGLHKVVDTAAKSFKPSSYAVHAAGGLVGGEMAYKEGASPMEVAGGAVLGLIGLPLAVHTAGELMTTPQGRQLLQSLNKPGVTVKHIADFTKSLVVGGISKYFNQQHSDIPLDSPEGE